MATIRKLRGKWQAMVRLKGAKPKAKSFTLKADATAWTRKLETEIKRGIFVDTWLLKKRLYATRLNATYLPYPITTNVA